MDTDTEPDFEERPEKDKDRDQAIRGIQKTQDRHSRVFEAFREQFATFREEEDRTHDMLREGVSRIDARFDKYLFGGRVAWSFVGLITIVIVAYQASLDIRMRTLKAEVEAVSQRQAAWEPFATQWGNALGATDQRNEAASRERHEQQQHELEEIQQEIRELRRRIGGR